MPRKERVSTILCGVALLLSPASGNALDVDAKSFRCITKMTPVRRARLVQLRESATGIIVIARQKTRTYLKIA